MTQPTQGPSELIIDDGRLIIVGSRTHGDIAEFFYCEESTVKTTRDEALANARLFMAAAKLQAALEGLIELQNDTEMTHEDAYQSMFKRPGSAVWEAAREALRQLEPPDDDRSMRVSGAAR